VAAAVARRVPALAARPVLLVSSGQRSIVVHADPSAVTAGVTTGMSVDGALARCAGAQAVPCPPNARDALSDMLRESFDAEVWVGGHDEAALALRHGDPRGPDLSPVEAWFGRTLAVDAYAAAAVDRLAARVAAHCRGIVPVLVAPGEEHSLSAAPLGCLPWLPRRGVETLAHQWAVFTIGDLRELPGAFALKVLGREGLDLHTMARGSRPGGGPDAQARVTLAPPANDKGAVRRAVLCAVDEAWHRLSDQGVGTRRLELRVWRAGAAPARGSATFDPDAEDPVTLGGEACRLLGNAWSRRAAAAVDIRLWAGAKAGVQLPLFPDLRPARLGRLGDALAVLRHRFGPSSVRRASAIYSVQA
jgi:hypothetical protein